MPRPDNSRFYCEQHQRRHSIVKGCPHCNYEATHPKVKPNSVTDDWLDEYDTDNLEQMRKGADGVGRVAFWATMIPLLVGILFSNQGLLIVGGLSSIVWIGLSWLHGRIQRELERRQSARGDR